MTHEQRKETDDLRSHLKLLSLRPEQRNGHRIEVDPEYEEKIRALRADIKRKSADGR
jgi:hypothetical protein